MVPPSKGASIRRKFFKIKVLGNGISSPLRSSKFVIIISHFFLIWGT